MEVHGVGGVDELRVPHGVVGVLVHPRVETGVIVVTDLFPWGGGAMQLHHIGASAKERLARLQRGLDELVQLVGATWSRTDPGSLVEFQG